MLVAVYGTLKRGESNHGVMRSANAAFRGEDTLAGMALYDLGPYPAARPHPALETRVEIYEIDAAMLSILDTLEGYRGDSGSDLFTRREVATRFGPAWVYFYNGNVDGRRELRCWSGRQGD